jgi:hypothetical protein
MKIGQQLFKIKSGQGEFAIFIKGHNPEVAEAIWLVIELG